MPARLERCHSAAEEVNEGGVGSGEWAIVTQGGDYSHCPLPTAHCHLPVLELSAVAFTVVSRMPADATAVFGSRSRWDNIELAVAQISMIAEPAAGHRGFVTCSQTSIDIALLHCSERRTDVFEFLINGVRNFAEPNNERQHSDRRDQDQFRRDNKPGLVVVQCIQKLAHGVPLLVLSGWSETLSQSVNGDGHDLRPDTIC